MRTEHVPCNAIPAVPCKQTKTIVCGQAVTSDPEGRDFPWDEHEDSYSPAATPAAADLFDAAAAARGKAGAGPWKPPPLDSSSTMVAVWAVGKLLLGEWSCHPDQS